MMIFGGYEDALWQLLLDCVKQHMREKRRTVVLVPGHYTLDTERRLLYGLRLPGFFDIEVLSPARMKSRVAELAGTSRLTHIDRCGRQMLLSRVITENADALVYYRAAAGRLGFTEKIAGEITQFKQAGVLPEELERHAGSDKLKDIALLYAAYTEALRDRYADSQDETRDMLSRLGDSGLLENAALLVWGFDSMTAEMGMMLAECARYAYGVKVFCQMTEAKLYSPVRMSALRMQEQMQKAGIPCELRYIPPLREGKHPEIRFLSEHLTDSRPPKWQNVPQAISLFAAPNTHTELHLICEKMLVMNRQGMDFGDMTLVFDGTPSTAAAVRAVTDAYRVPAYIAVKQPALSHRAARFILGSLRAADGFHPQDVLDVIKSGFSPLTEQEGFLFENYITAYGVRFGAFTQPFFRGSEKELSECEPLRKKLIAPLETLKQGFSSPCDTLKGLNALWNYIKEADLEGRLNALTEQLEQAGLPDRAVQTAQMMSCVLSLCEQTEALLSGMPCTPASLSEVLEAGFAARELASLPPTAGCVSCGAAGGIPLSDKKAVFACSLTDSLLSPAGSELLNDREKEELEHRLKVHLSFSGPEKDTMKWLDLLKIFSAPSEKLILSHPQSAPDGRALRPLSMLGRVRSLFPALAEEGGVTLTQGASRPLAPLPALDTLPLMLRGGQPDKEWKEAWQYLSTAPEYAGRAAALRRALSREEQPPLPRDVTKRLFTERRFSVSGLENYARCPFKYFVAQGLRPEKRKEWKIEASDSGTFYHDAMEGFTRMLPELPGWPNITKAECDEAMERAVKPLMEDMLTKKPMGESARLRAAGERYKKTLRRVAWTFTRTAQYSAFRPAGQEVSFGFQEEGSLPALPITLEDGSIALLQGRIDRIDRYEDDEGLYLRVVDYKSSAKELNAKRIFWGAQLQLLIYLAAAESVFVKDRSVLPAGAFYFHVADSLVDEPKDPKLLEKKLADELRLKGVVLKDARVVRLMDTGGEIASLPQYLKKDSDEFVANKMVATLEEMRALLEKTKRAAGSMITAIAGGHFDVTPLCDEGDSPCTYCDYAAICRRDPTDASSVREMGKMTFDELLEIALAESKKTAGPAEDASDGR